MSLPFIGFIGVGNMGLPMALNLQKADFKVRVFDLSEKALKAARTAGLISASSVTECVRDADFIISMLPSGQNVEDLYCGNGRLLELASPHSLLIDSSTISPESAQRVAQASQAKGFEMLDAPVSGGTSGATAGTLTFMVGGTNETFKKAEPILRKMGKNIFHCGPSGAGQVTKICNNMLLAIHMIGTSEALNLGRNCGMDPKKLTEVMLQSSGRNWSLESYNPFPGVLETSRATAGYTGGFAVDLMAKDLNLAQESALNTHTVTPLGKIALELYRMQSLSGQGHLDFSSILQFLQPGKP